MGRNRSVREWIAHEGRYRIGPLSWLLLACMIKLEQCWHNFYCPFIPPSTLCTLPVYHLLDAGSSETLAASLALEFPSPSLPPFLPIYLAFPHTYTRIINSLSPVMYNYYFVIKWFAINLFYVVLLLSLLCNCINNRGRLLVYSRMIFHWPDTPSTIISSVLQVFYCRVINNLLFLIDLLPALSVSMRF